MTNSEQLPNIQTALGAVVHKGAMKREFGSAARHLAPACMTTRQLERLRFWGSGTDAEVTCTKAKCQG